MRHTVCWLVITGVLIPAVYADCCKDAVAVVASIKGTATAHVPGGKKTSLSFLDWLPRGSIVELSKNGDAVLILLNGHRYELYGGSSAAVAADGVVQESGRVAELPLLPMPTYPPIADVGTTPAAVRFRGSNDIQNLYPHSGTLALPSSVRLQFSPVHGAVAYDITIEEDGNEVMSLRDSSNSISVSSSLKPGTRYAWKVHAISNSGVLAKGSAEFSTLSAANIEQRAAFAEALHSADDASRMALMGAIDLRLGLIAEACDEFEHAMQLRPGDDAVQRSLNAAKRTLTGK